MLRNIMIVALLMLSGCRDKSMDVPNRDLRPMQGDRVSVELISTFPDSEAYNSVRKVYIIRDNTTGREYFGVTGVGISEVGTHSNGKSSSTHER